MSHLRKFVLEYLNPCLEELPLILFKSDNPLFTVLRRIACHDKLLADLGSFENDLESMRTLGCLFVNLDNYEVVQRVEFPWIEVPLLLCVEIDNSSISNDAELLSPLVSFEHPLCAFPYQPDPSALNVHVVEDFVNKFLVPLAELNLQGLASLSVNLGCSEVLLVHLFKEGFSREVAIATSREERFFLILQVGGTLTFFVLSILFRS